MPGFFEKFNFEVKAFSYVRMGLSLAKHLISPQKMFSILIFGSPVCTLLIPCLSLLKKEGDLDSKNIQKNGEQTILQNYLHDEDKGVREETIFSIFRWNIVLHDTRQMKL